MSNGSPIVKDMDSSPALLAKIYSCINPALFQKATGHSMRIGMLNFPLGLMKMMVSPRQKMSQHLVVGHVWDPRDLDVAVVEEIPKTTEESMMARVPRRMEIWATSKRAELLPIPMQARRRSLSAHQEHGRRRNLSPSGTIISRRMSSKYSRINISLHLRGQSIFPTNAIPTMTESSSGLEAMPPWRIRIRILPKGSSKLIQMVTLLWSGKGSSTVPMMAIGMFVQIRAISSLN
mmetsp:Transcript_26542/g.40588  ORF Transcript_26542/g.40588 Transcript_26542/m.40588 type:complete len:234 (+) Transcript_26542:219-920(+)